MKFRHIFAASLMAASSSAMAGDLDISTLDGAQESFDELSENLTAAMSYKSVTPAEALSGGILPFGFDVGLEKSRLNPDAEIGHDRQSHFNVGPGKHLTPDL